MTPVNGVYDFNHSIKQSSIALFFNYLQREPKPL